MSDNRITIELTEQQLAHIGHACEVVARLRIWQIGDALRELPTTDGYGVNDYGVKAAIEHLLSQFKPSELKKTDDDLDYWHIHTSVRHWISTREAVAKGWIDSPDSPRNWQHMIGVCFDPPMATKTPVAIKEQH